MKLRYISTGEILNNCFINSYNGCIELELFDNEIKDFIVIEQFKTLKDLLNLYEEI